MSYWRPPQFDGVTWAKGTIYYILSAETDRVKIGFTKGDPVKRLKALQTGSPTRIGIAAIHPGDEALERQLHEQFAADRVHGEWFEMSDAMLVHLAGVISLTIALHKSAGRGPPPWAVEGERALRELCDMAVGAEGETLQ